MSKIAVSKEDLESLALHFELLEDWYISCYPDGTPDVKWLSLMYDIVRKISKKYEIKPIQEVTKPCPKTNGGKISNG